MDNYPFSILDPLVLKNKKPIKSFKDPRIAGFQAIVDSIYSRSGENKNFNSVDITEFFRLNEK